MFKSVSDGVRIRPWMVWLARTGYIVRGLAYFLVGYLAFLAAWGQAQVTNTSGALIKLLQEPAGRYMLMGMAGGLIVFGLWRCCQALGVETSGNTTWTWTQRGTSAINTIIYFILGFTALSPLLGLPVHSGHKSASLWTAWLMEKPFGVWLVGAVGLIVAGVGVYWCVSAFVKNPMPSLTLSKQHRYWVRPLCWYGLFSWGVTLGLAGAMFVFAAVNHNSSDAGGVQGALKIIQRQTFGQWLLTILSFGLAAFGVISILEGFCRKIGEEGLFD